MIPADKLQNLKPTPIIILNQAGSTSDDKKPMAPIINTITAPTKTNSLSSICFLQLFSKIKLVIIPLSTFSDIPRIHLACVGVRNSVKALTCGTVIPICFCFANEIPDHNPQVIIFGGLGCV